MKKLVVSLVLFLFCSSCSLFAPVAERLKPLKGEWELEVSGIEPDFLSTQPKREWIMLYPELMDSSAGESVEVVYAGDTFCLYPGGYSYCYQPRWFGGLVDELPSEHQLEGYEWFVYCKEYVKYERIHDDYQFVKEAWWYFNFTSENGVSGIVENAEGGWSDFSGRKQ